MLQWPGEEHGDSGSLVRLVAHDIGEHAISISFCRLASSSDPLHGKISSLWEAYVGMLTSGTFQGYLSGTSWKTAEHVLNRHAEIDAQSVTGAFGVHMRCIRAINYFAGMPQICRGPSTLSILGRNQTNLLADERGFITASQREGIHTTYIHRSFEQLGGFCINQDWGLAGNFNFRWQHCSKQVCSDEAVTCTRMYCIARNWLTIQVEMIASPQAGVWVGFYRLGCVACWMSSEHRHM